MDFREYIENNKIILLVLPNETYSKVIMDIARKLDNAFKGIIYVNMNNLHSSLMKKFKENNINENNFFFVDVITKSTMSDFKEPENCISVGSPSDLSQIGIVISEALKEGDFQCLLFDSLSTLLIYNRGSDVTMFVNSVISKARTFDTVAVFSVLEDDTASSFIKKLGMFVDKTINFD